MASSSTTPNLGITAIRETSPYDERQFQLWDIHGRGSIGDVYGINDNYVALMITIPSSRGRWRASPGTLFDRALRNLDGMRPWLRNRIPVIFVRGNVDDLNRYSFRKSLDKASSQGIITYFLSTDGDPMAISYQDVHRRYPAIVDTVPNGPPTLYGSWLSAPRDVDDNPTLFNPYEAWRHGKPYGRSPFSPRGPPRETPLPRLPGLRGPLPHPPVLTRHGYISSIPMPYQREEFLPEFERLSLGGPIQTSPRRSPTSSEYSLDELDENLARFEF